MRPPRSVYPADLRIAARWVLRTRDRILWAAQHFNDTEGGQMFPLRLAYNYNGGGWYADSKDGKRVIEVAGALRMLAEAGLDPHVLIALREKPVYDDEAFGAVASGMTVDEAVTRAETHTLPPVKEMFAFAALRGVDTRSIHDEDYVWPVAG